MTWLNMSIEEISSGRGRSISLVRTTSLVNEEAPIWPILLRAGATLPQDVPRFSDPYLERIRELGSFPAYEKAHRQSFVALLAPKFPRLPVDALSHVVSFWAHVGNY